MRSSTSKRRRCSPTTPRSRASTQSIATGSGAGPSPRHSPKDGCCATLLARRYDLLLHLTEHPRGLTLATLLRPRFAVTRERTDGGALWRRRFTHFYRLPRQTPRHAVEANLDALRRIGVLPGTGGQEARARPGCGRACARRRAVARARRDADELRARASRLAVALQVPAGGAAAQRSSTGSPRADTGSSSPARRTRASARSSTRYARSSRRRRARKSRISPDN